MSLGMVGLILALPVILFALPAGHVADRYDRKKVVYVCHTILTICSLWLAWIAWHGGSIFSIYLCIFITGVARAFSIPAGMSLLPKIVAPEHFQNAVTWNSTGFELASVVGPASAGFLIAFFGSPSVYLINGFTSILCIILFVQIKVQATSEYSESMSLQNLAAGVHFVWNSKVILATITLDLFAVLLGGATTLLPVYAKDILHVGPTGLGWLRAAPSIGAIVMALTIAHLPPFRSAGKALLWAVTGFGIATIIFGISENFLLSMFMLILLGAFDNISVVVRHTLVQVLTPDHMRGRVNAVNSVFIGTSNELGGFESGLVAHLFNPIISVVSGGIGTILVVLGCAKIWPEVKNLKSLQEPAASTPYEEIEKS
jgi:MFS family permease